MIITHELEKFSFTSLLGGELVLAAARLADGFLDEPACKEGSQLNGYSLLEGTLKYNYGHSRLIKISFNVQNNQLYICIEHKIKRRNRTAI